MTSLMNKDIIKKRANDILFYGIDKSYGGYGIDFHRLYLEHYNLGFSSNDTNLILSLNAHLWGGVFPLIFCGSEIQRKKYIPQLLHFDLCAGHAITEEHAGSNINSIITQTQEVEGGFLLNGAKRYVTNCSFADVLTIYAKNEHNKLNAFLVFTNDIGVSISQNNTTTSFNGSGMGEILFDKCFLPQERLIGKDGAGSIIFQKVIELERAFLFAGIVGIMQRQLDFVVDFIKKKVVNNKQLKDYSHIASIIAEIALSIETIKLWIEKCVKAQNQGKSLTLISSYTKLFASEEFVKSSCNIIKVLGALGLEKNNIFSTLVLDSLGTQILSGTNDIQRNIISTYLTL